jgi:preprotein translocase subunit SecD
MSSAYKSIQVMLFFSAVALSLLMITNIIPLNPDKGVGFGNGLDYGIDFAGGTQLQLRLEHPVESDVMNIQKTIIENRLNRLGLKDIPVRPWGNQYLLVQMASATPEETAKIESIIEQQARFETRIDGEVAIWGDEITVDLGPQGSQIYPYAGGYSWAVSVEHSRDGACRFGEVADGKRGRPVDIFIDRPQNTTIIFSKGDYDLLDGLTEVGESDSFYFGDSAIGVIEKRALIPTVSATSTTQAVEEVLILFDTGVNHVILAGDVSRLGDDLRNTLADRGFTTERKPQENLSYEGWISQMIGLMNSPRLNFDTGGECVYRAQITGVAASLEDAQREVQGNQVLLTSGNLPVPLSIESKSTTPPTLGRTFLAYSLYTALAAVLAVGLVIYIRYRRFDILLPIMSTMTGDIIMILGFAAFINWELDLPALAGIIAAVGTGVDHQIVLTDESLKHDKNKKVVSAAERIRKAFFIIFTSAATMAAAMLPLMTIGAGMLKGFAFTTLMGVLIGVTISRPAYAKVVREIIKKEK